VRRNKNHPLMSENGSFASPRFVRDARDMSAMPLRATGMAPRNEPSDWPMGIDASNLDAESATFSIDPVPGA
jgi:hypothetical protein